LKSVHEPERPDFGQNKWKELKIICKNKSRYGNDTTNNTQQQQKRQQQHRQQQHKHQKQKLMLRIGMNYKSIKHIIHCVMIIFYESNQNSLGFFIYFIFSPFHEVKNLVEKNWWGKASRYVWNVKEEEMD
jgi:hypothetical protein